MQTFKQKIDSTIKLIQEQYLADDMPWIIGYSGGKDSTATLQIIMYALDKLPKEKLTKKVHVVTNDTLVENPAIVNYVDKQIALINHYGQKKLFPHFKDLFKAVKLKPELKDRFWLNLLGKGYPAPNRWFRWCTDRLKINPTNQYIKQTINKHSNAIVVLGTRKAESANRKKSMEKHEINIDGIHLRRHSIRNTWVFAPIAEWTTDEVWKYLMSVPNYWRGDNKQLVTLYRNAAPDVKECPLVIDTSTPSCGKSRFGCWVCTVVSKDSSMENLIEHGEDWMLPMLEFRDYLAEVRNDATKRFPHSRVNKKQLGPFTYETRAELLKLLFEVQKEVQEKDKDLQLINKEEIEAIQVQWNYDGNFEHNVSDIFQEVFGVPLLINNEQVKQKAEENLLLDKVCEEQDVNPDHIRTLMAVEENNQNFLRRTNIFKDIRKKLDTFVED